MAWALPATMLRPYKQCEDHLNIICIPCVWWTPETIFIQFGVSRPCKGHAPRTGKPIKQVGENTTWAKSRKNMAGPKPKKHGGAKAEKAIGDHIMNHHM